MLYVSQIYCLKIILTLHFLRIPRGQVNYIYPKIICIYHAKLRNLYAGQEATVRTGHWTTDWFQIGKEYIKAVYCHPAYLTYMQNTSWEMLGWMMHKLESRLPGEISITSDMQIIPLLWQKVKKNSRASWRKWKGWLKAQQSEKKIMASGPITSWKINGETVETVADFIFRGLQNHCRWWLQPWN